jgi:predicted secreted protein
MNWIGSIFIYIVVWWVVLFAVLPWGVKREENPEPGHDPGAPAVTHLKRKLIATTLITFVLWGIGVFLFVHYGLSLTMLEHPEPQ